MYFHADEVSEKVRAAGGSWEEADKALENWLLDDKNRYKEWALNFHQTVFIRGVLLLEIFTMITYLPNGFRSSGAGLED